MAHALAHALAHTLSARMTSALHKRWPIPLLDVSIVAVVLMLLPCGICVSKLLFCCPVTTIMTNLDDLIASLQEALAREGQT